MQLTGFLKKLKNERVSIELKNGTTVWGIVRNVSPQMNVSLTDVRLTLPVKSSEATLAAVLLSGGSTQGQESKRATSLEFINIRGNTIRQIILPDSINLDALLVDQQEVNRLRKQGQLGSDPNKKRTIDGNGSAPKRPRRAF
ncbi:unnamed protein product [Kluyveromyces dobzhanskii CBS 2104]|uniref:WGS project CCBQ000000000 data, contig 00098 n=1 Tax=Kluyveromyces dobzhanskii CBS 2104 TaxID=1427455 RepID=A0A0A8L5M5_9SACH|nr:unnamed protein product [Kluyveromyces dobzhanskii CBS 2104]